MTDTGTQAIIERGKGLSQQGDLAGAAACYRSAYELGDARALWRLGVVEARRGDTQAALDWLTLADEQGDPEGSYNLGVLLAEQLNDLERAAVAYRRADEAGHAGGATNLGVILARGDDESQALAALHRGRARGDVQAIFCIGVLHDKAGDVQSATAFYREAAENGHGNAAFNLEMSNEQIAANMLVLWEILDGVAEAEDVLAGTGERSLTQMLAERLRSRGAVGPPRQMSKRATVQALWQARHALGELRQATSTHSIRGVVFASNRTKQLITRAERQLTGVGDRELQEGPCAER